MAPTFLFPGQGAQWVGMGHDLYTEFACARALYDEAADVLGADFKALCFDGPAETLTLTRHAQPALFVHSLACHAVLMELTEGRLAPAAVAGHSVGEYPALVVAGALSFADGLRLVQARGDCMDRLGEGRMAALSLTEDEAAPLARAFYCDIAVLNLPRQTVVGGREADVAALQAALEADGKSPGVLLETSGAFHTHLMIRAALEFRAHLDAATFLPPQVPALSNLTARAHDAAGVRAALFYQIFSPVRWSDLADHLVATGHTRFIELGGGQGGPPPSRGRLEAIMKRVLKSQKASGDHLAVVTAATARETAAAL
ncbi:MAG: ACP S-malonyltransferase [bacterium]